MTNPVQELKAQFDDLKHQNRGLEIKLRHAINGLRATRPLMSSPGTVAALDHLLETLEEPA